MKRFIFVCLLTLIVPIMLICHRGSDEFILPAAFASESGTDGTLGVDQLMKNVDQYHSSVRVEGVVSAVSPAQHLLSLIDKQEFSKCAVVTCAALTLPVRWAGSMPSVKDEVRVEGKIKENKGKLIFEAKGLEVAAPRSGGSR